MCLLQGYGGADSPLGPALGVAPSLCFPSPPCPQLLFGEPLLHSAHLISAHLTTALGRCALYRGVNPSNSVVDAELTPGSASLRNPALIPGFISILRKDLGPSGCSEADPMAGPSLISSWPWTECWTACYPTLQMRGPRLRAAAFLSPHCREVVGQDPDPQLPFSGAEMSARGSSVPQGISQWLESRQNWGWGLLASQRE